MRFTESGVRDVVRSVVLPLWNAYSFFATYAAVDEWAPPEEPTPVAERALMDKWIISMAQSLVRDMNVEMEAYRLYNVIPRVLGFIDHLTNWYIRRSRRRFWHNEDSADKQHAFETLYEVLCIFSRLLAPILPFMADILYQRLEAGKRRCRGLGSPRGLPGRRRVAGRCGPRGGHGHHARGRHPGSEPPRAEPHPGQAAPARHQGRRIGRQRCPAPLLHGRRSGRAEREDRHLDRRRHRAGGPEREGQLQGAGSPAPDPR